MSQADRSDFTSMRELEYIASVYMQHGDLDKAAEIMSLAEQIGRRVAKNEDDNISWMEDYRELEDRNQA